jgi:hypothetical protein
MNNAVNDMKKVAVFTILFCLFLMINGCASKGIPFQEVADVPESRGVVYIYMPSDKNIAAQSIVFVDNTESMGIPLGKLNNGKYIAYIAPVGENLFRVGKKGVSVDVVAGESYFVKITSHKFFIIHYKLENVDPSAGFVHIMQTTQQQ